MSLRVLYSVIETLKGNLDISDEIIYFLINKINDESFEQIYDLMKLELIKMKKYSHLKRIPSMVKKLYNYNDSFCVTTDNAKKYINLPKEVEDNIIIIYKNLLNNNYNLNIYFFIHKVCQYYDIHLNKRYYIRHLNTINDQIWKNFCEKHKLNFFN